MDIKLKLADLVVQRVRPGAKTVSEIAEEALAQIEKGDALATALIEYTRTLDGAQDKLKARLNEIEKQWPRKP